MITSNFQPLTPNGGLRKNSARVAPAEFWILLDFSSRGLISNGIPSSTTVWVSDPFFSQPLRGRNFFVGRRWELGAENLRLSCWNMFFKTVGTDF